MTQQSGQGAASSDPHPAERHAHEGIVLPADGSEPLMPGTTGDHVAPSGGSPWGQPWGPAPADPPPGSGQAWDSAPGQQQSYGAGTPLPAEGAQQQGYAQGGSYGHADASYGGQGYGTQAPAGSYGGQTQGTPYGTQAAGAPYAGQQQDGQYGGHAQGGQHGGQAQGGQYGGQAQGGQHGGHAQHGQHAGQPGDGSYAGPGAGGAYAGQQAGGAHAGQHSGGAHAGQQAGGTHAGQRAGGAHAGQQAGGTYAGQQAGGAHAGQTAGGTHAGQQAGGAHAGQQAGGAHARQAAGGAHAGQAADAAYPGQPGHALPPAGQAGQLPPAGQAGQLPPAGQANQLPPGAQAGQLPPAASGAGAPLPPVAGGLAPLPPAGAGDADATQYIPATPGAGAGFDEGATQYIPPVAPGALPPEAPAGDATQFLGRSPMPGASAPGAPMPPAAGPDSEPTQFIAPVPAEPGKAPFGIRPGAPGDRQPPAEFDSLFRTEQAEPEGPASTQQMPRFDPQQPAAHGGDGGGRAARRAAAAAPAPRGEGGRTGSKVPLFAAIGVAIAVIGVGAGALLSGGGGDEEKAAPKTVSDSAPSDEKPSPSVDPAEEQAIALDKLLADSNNSRDSVIAAVRNVGKCDNLSQSATDLRNAAKQRNGLVTRLSQLSVDKLPANAQLTASLTKAWKASAAADNHYAAWAGQVAGKKGCKKGHARGTPQAVAGNKSSGEATTAKQEAAGLWNAIAQKYGLTKRDKSQL
ncbi:hypothetical protein ABZ916_30640 [Streptomyces sp. NPDC046853]|uniref:hypothetical protein n=1 Tax=Streptomyces sp. NPDC046853 TaxID=3154920 RepID=UPI0033F9AC22